MSVFRKINSYKIKKIHSPSKNYYRNFFWRWNVNEIKSYFSKLSIWPMGFSLGQKVTSNSKRANSQINLIGVQRESLKNTYIPSPSWPFIPFWPCPHWRTPSQPRHRPDPTCHQLFWYDLLSAFSDELVSLGQASGQTSYAYLLTRSYHGSWRVSFSCP